MSKLAKKSKVALPIPLPAATASGGIGEHNQLRPKPQRYADKTWMPPRGTRRSMGKR